MHANYVFSVKNVIAITESAWLRSVGLEVIDSISKNHMVKSSLIRQIKRKRTKKLHRIWGIYKFLESVKGDCGIVRILALHNCRFFMAGRSVVDFETIDTQSFNNLLSDSQSPKWRLFSG